MTLYVRHYVHSQICGFFVRNNSLLKCGNTYSLYPNYLHTSWTPISAFQEERRVFNFGLMVRGLSLRPNLPEGPSVTWGRRWSIKEEQESQIRKWAYTESIYASIFWTNRIFSRLDLRSRLDGINGLWPERGVGWHLHFQWGQKSFYWQ
jgi:hypothetical protein